MVYLCKRSIVDLDDMLAHLKSMEKLKSEYGLKCALCGKENTCVLVFNFLFYFVSFFNFYWVYFLYFKNFKIS
jgi:hypothetical protein